MPNYFPENNAAKPSDPLERSMAKVVSAMPTVLDYMFGTFYRDFAGRKTLNHGIGPNINFTRGSSGTYFDANGTLQTASNDTPRFDHSGGTSLGLLIEEARTNSLRNSQGGGSANGVLGSATVPTPALPTNWAGLATNGIVTEVVGTGTENGIAYIDLKYSGTPTASGAFYPTPEAANFVSASSGQVWTFSAYVKVAAGSTANTVIKVYCSERGSGGADLANTGVTITPTTASLASQRVSVTRTFNNGSTNFALGFLGVDYTSGQAINITLRVAAPQLEQGALPTSYIPTTTVAVERLADSAVVAPISGFYNQSEGTFVTATNKSPLSGSFPTIWHLTNGTDDVGNVIGFYNPSNSTISYDASPAFSFAESVSAGLAVSGFAFSATSARMAVNGVLEPSTDQSATITTDKAALRLGGKRNGSEPLNGHVRKIAYYPKRLSNALLQSLTT